MKLLHSSIQLSQKVLHVILLNSTEQNIINVLLVFRNYVQKLRIDCSKSIPSVFSVDTFPLDSQICHSTRFGNILAAVTKDAHVLFFSADLTLKLIKISKLADRLSPSQIPIAHFLPSIQHKFLICCGFTKNLVIISNIDHNFEEVKIELPDFIVLCISPCHDDNIFAFLILNPDGKKSVIFLDVLSQKYSPLQEFAVPGDTYKILSLDEGKSIIALTKTSIVLIRDGKSIPSIQISSYFFPSPNYLIYQTIDGNMFGLNTAEFAAKPIGKLPLSSILYMLSPTLLLSVSEHRNLYFLSIPPISDNISTQFSFDEMPKHELSNDRNKHYHPRIIAATFNNRNLITASGEGSESTISSIQNTIEFSRQNMVQIHLDEHNIHKPQIYYIDSETLVLSTAIDTRCIIGSVENLSSNSTITIDLFNGNMIQIHRKGINVLDDEKQMKWDAPDEITSATIGPENIFISLKENNRCLVLDADFNIKVDKTVGDVFCATFCDQSIVIATQSDGLNHSMISLYSLDLNPGDSVVHLTSQVVSMHYCQQLMELYVSTDDGFVYKFNFNCSGGDFEETIVTIYSGKVTPIIRPFLNLIMIVADRIFLYNGQQMLSLSSTMPGVSLLSATACENTIYQLESDGSVSIATVEEMETDMTTKLFYPNLTPRRIANLGNLTITVTRSNEMDKVKSQLMIIDNDEIGLPMVNLPIVDNEGNEENVGAISILVVPNSPQVMLGCYRRKKVEGNQIHFSSHHTLNSSRSGETYVTQYFLNVIEFPQSAHHQSKFELNQENLPRSVQMIPFKETLNEPPYVMSFINGFVLLGINRHIYLTARVDGKWSILEDPLASIHTQLSFIEVFENFVWVGDKTQSVVCFLFSLNTDKNQKGPKLYPIAIDTEPRQLTAMKVIDKSKIAVGDKFGTIAILKLHDDAVADTNNRWRFYKPLERGVYMPPSAHLIKIASFNVGESITSLMKSQFSPALFYTSLLGQIGSLIPIAQEEENDFFALQTAEAASKQCWQKEFPLMKLKKFDHLKVSVVDLDIIELMDQLSLEAQMQIENTLKNNNKVTNQQIMGIMGKYKTLCKF